MWIWITLALMLAAPAAAQEPTCVTVCEAKADACAGQCTEVSEEDFADCQLTCAKVLFQRCVASCQVTNEVVWDDYRVSGPERK